MNNLFEKQKEPESEESHKARMDLHMNSDGHKKFKEESKELVGKFNSAIKKDLIDVIAQLPVAIRNEVLSHFCSHCGGYSLESEINCQCWNDE